MLELFHISLPYYQFYPHYFKFYPQFYRGECELWINSTPILQYVISTTHVGCGKLFCWL